jgi:hypothetical protein
VVGRDEIWVVRGGGVEGFAFELEGIDMMMK